MAEARLREALSTLGFSEKEVEAYLAVLSRGTASMRTVSEAASVSQSYVYEIAVDLADRGLVTVDESVSPTVLRARPPEEVVDALAADLETYEEAATALYSEADRTEPGFEAIHSPQTVRRRLVRHAEAADHELLVVLPGDAIGVVAGELAAAIDRGVLVYCMLTGGAVEASPSERPAVAAPPNVHVLRTWAAPAPVVLVRDAVGGVVGGHRTVAERPPDEEYAVAFTQPQIGGAIFGNAVGNVWPMGEERGVADPPDLPATYEQFRAGVSAAALHERAGTDLVADLAPVETETGRRHEFEGVPVREVRQGLVEPRNVRFPIETALVVETADGPVSVAASAAGISPYLEGFAAEEVTLRRAD